MFILLIVDYRFLQRKKFSTSGYSPVLLKFKYVNISLYLHKFRFVTRVVIWEIGHYFFLDCLKRFLEIEMYFLYFSDFIWRNFRWKQIKKKHVLGNYEQYVGSKALKWILSGKHDISFCSHSVLLMLIIIFILFQYIRYAQCEFWSILCYTIN